jgi:hypothetical protein
MRQFRDCCAQDAIDFFGEPDALFDNIEWQPVPQSMITALRFSQ